EAITPTGRSQRTLDSGQANSAHVGGYREREVMEWTPPADAASSCQAATAKRPGQARRGPHGAFARHGYAACLTKPVRMGANGRKVRPMVGRLPVPGCLAVAAPAAATSSLRAVRGEDAEERVHAAADREA